MSFSESSEIATCQDTGILRLMLGQDEVILPINAPLEFVFN